MRAFHIGIGLGHAAELLVFPAAFGASVFVHWHGNISFADPLQRAGVQPGFPVQAPFLQQVIQAQCADVVVKLFQNLKTEGVLAGAVPLFLQSMVPVIAQLELEPESIPRGIEVG